MERNRPKLLTHYQERRRRWTSKWEMKLTLRCCKKLWGLCNVGASISTDVVVLLVWAGCRLLPKRPQNDVGYITVMLMQFMPLYAKVDAQPTILSCHHGSLFKYPLLCECIGFPFVSKTLLLTDIRIGFTSTVLVSTISPFLALSL